MGRYKKKDVTGVLNLSGMHKTEITDIKTGEKATGIGSSTTKADKEAFKNLKAKKSSFAVPDQYTAPSNKKS